MTDKVFTWVDDMATRRMGQLDVHLMATGPAGQARLSMFQNMLKAQEVFPWEVVDKDLIRRDAWTLSARKVHVYVDSSVVYGFVLTNL